MFATYYESPNGYRVRGFLLPDSRVEIFEEFGNGQSQTVGIFSASRVTAVVLSLLNEELEF